MISTRRLSFSICLLTAMVIPIVGGCIPERGEVNDGSNTNWMSYCDDNAYCGSDAACICGLCTQTCVRDDTCVKDDKPASCVNPMPASSKSGCAAFIKEAKARICLPDCRDNQDCGDRSLCIKGDCWPFPKGIVDQRRDASALAPPLVVTHDGQAAAIEDTSVIGPLSNDLDELDAAMDFSEPVFLPEPEILISGVSSASSIIGIWEEDSEDNILTTGPIRLTIQEATDSTGLIGTMTLTCNSRLIAEGLCQEEPLPVATDPDEPYPPLSVLDSNFYVLGPLVTQTDHPIPYFSYRIFDPSMEENRLWFWITDNDLWRDWCALQTAHPFDNSGRLEYSCSVDPKPSIDNTSYSALLTHLQTLYGKENLCSLDRSVCSCGVEGCTANYRESVRTFDFLVDGEVMRGPVTRGDQFDSIVEGFDYISSDVVEFVLYRVQGESP